MKLDAEQIFLNIFIPGFLQVDVNISEGHPVTFSPCNLCAAPVLPAAESDRSVSFIGQQHHGNAYDNAYDFRQQLE